MKAPQEQKKGIAAGVYNAVCYSLIDTGTAVSKFDGRKKRNIILGWRLLDEKYPDGNCLKIHKTVTFSMNEKATLRRFVQSWFSQVQPNLDDFDFRDLLNEGCQLVISPNSAGNNTVANIMPYETAVTFDDVELFSLDEWNGGELPAHLDEWKKNQIKESDEYKEKTNPTSAGIRVEQPANLIEVDSDEVPF